MRTRLAGLLCLLAFIAPFALAQTTGSMSGVVRDESGRPLAGALVSIVGPQLPLGRSTTSRSDGVFQFFNLLPGTYTLKAEIQGLATFQQQVQVELTKDTEVRPVLRATRTEAVEVTAATPLVDTKASDVSVVTTRKTMEKLPLQRTFSGTFQLAPGVADSGVAISNTNVGVNAGGGRQDNTYLYDGVNVTNPFFGDLYQDFAELDIQEVNITRSGVPADSGRTGGFLVNGVTKSGTNNWHGEARLEYQPSAFEADSKDPNLQTKIERFRPGAGAGGPIVHDHLFAYGSLNFYRVKETDRVNDLGPIPDSNLDINEYFIKLSATPTQNQLFDASYRYRSITQTNADIGAFDAASTGDNPKELNRVGLFSWYWTATPSFNLEAKFSVNDNPSGAYPVTALGYQPPFNAADPSQSGYFCNGVNCFGGAPLAINDDSFRRYTYNLAGSYLANFFGASHLMKLGAYFSNNKETVSRIANGWGTITNSTSSNCGGEPCFRARYSPEQNPQISRGQTLGIFIQDQATWDRLTLNLGFLFNQDTFIPNDNGQFTFVQGDYTVPNSDLLPCSDPAHLAAACTYQGKYVFSFGAQVQPRIGVAYELTPSVHDKIYANFGRYSNMDNQSFARSAAPIRLYRVDAFFNSTTGDFITQFVRSNNTGKIVLPDIKPTRTDEWSLGYARPLPGGWAVEAYGMYRTIANVIEDFPATGLEDDPGNFRYGNIPANRTYKGITLEAKKVYGNNWTLDASYTLSALTGNWDLDYATQLFYTSSYIQDGPKLYVQDPNRTGTLIGNRTHVAKVFGSYSFPFRTTVGGYFRFQSGRPWEARYFDPIYGTDYWYAEPAGTRTTPSWANFDLLVSQTIPIGPTNLVIEGRLFNVFNSQPALTVDQDVYINDDNTGANPNFGRPTSYALPRRFVISATFNF
jgi:hypothetical protein